MLVAVTSGVFWLAHVYAHALGASVAEDRPPRLETLRTVTRHELSIVEAAVPSVGALLLGALGLYSEDTGVWIAFSLGLLVLGAVGLGYARIERLGPLATVGAVAVNLALGLVLIVLKLLVSH